MTIYANPPGFAQAMMAKEAAAWADARDAYLRETADSPPFRPAAPETKLAPIFLPEVKLAGGEASEPRFRGIASTSDADLAGDVIQAGAFGTKIDPDRVACLFSHRPEAIIGRWLSIEQRSGELLVEGQLVLEGSADAKRVAALLRAGAGLGLSVGFKVEDAQWNEKRRGRDIKRASLLEISIVSTPCNPRARIAKAAKPVEWNDEEDRLKGRLHCEVLDLLHSVQENQRQIRELAASMKR